MYLSTLWEGCVKSISGSKNPLQVVVQFLAEKKLKYGQESNEEISVFIQTERGMLLVSFVWLQEFKVLHLACAYEVEVARHLVPKLNELILLINRNLWTGQFNHWHEIDLLVFRHGILLADRTCTKKLCEEALQDARLMWEQFGPAFDMVLNRGISPQRAVSFVDTEAEGTPQ